VARDAVTAVEASDASVAHGVPRISTDRLNTVRRVVDVKGEQDAGVLWDKVKGKVKSVYRRKKTLEEWAALPGPAKTFPDYDALALALDNANQSKASKGRTRPGWAPGITNYFDKTYGGTHHRRHLVMSSLMRDAVYAVSDSPTTSQKDALRCYNEALSEVGYSSPKSDDLGLTEAALVYVLHNNPANLVQDIGVPNSAIGSLAHTTDRYVSKSNQELQVDYDAYAKDPAAFLFGLVGGFQPQYQKTIISMVNTFGQAGDLDEFRDFLEMFYDNMAFDLMTSKQLPKETQELLDLHTRFLAVRASGDAQMLYGVVMTYIMIGQRYKACPYDAKLW
jgi:hypothetical protein